MELNNHQQQQIFFKQRAETAAVRKLKQHARAASVITTPRNGTNMMTSDGKYYPEGLIYDGIMGGLQRSTFTAIQDNAYRGGDAGSRIRIQQMMNLSARDDNQRFPSSSSRKQ